jgi:hypothetical protein
VDYFQDKSYYQSEISPLLSLKSPKVNLIIKAYKLIPTFQIRRGKKGMIQHGVPKS